MDDVHEECTNLYIGDLHQNVTEKVLFEKFKEFGKIASICVRRDNKTKKPHGYAFIKFNKRFEAQSAMDNLNLTLIYGQPCRIMWFDKDPWKRKFGLGNIVIKNIDEDTTINEIHNIFSEFGEITSSKLKTDEFGLSIGFAYVNYRNLEDAEKAIEIMDNRMLGKNVITVEKFLLKELNSKDHLKNCYIDNCSVYLDDTILKMIFEKYGSVVTARIMVDENGMSKGFGFVSFKEIEDAYDAVENLNGQIIHDARIHVYQVNKKKETLNNNLYVNNLSKEIDDKELRQLFQIFGKILSAKVMVNPHSNKSLGYGFVSFAKECDAQRAVQEMNDKVIHGNSVFVTFNKSNVKKNPRQRQLSAPEMNTAINLNKISTNMVSPCKIAILPPNLQFIPPSYNLVRNTFSGLNIPCVNMLPSIQSSCGSNSKAKEMLGRTIYPAVCKYTGNMSFDVMNKLLELDNSVLLDLVDNEDLIRIHVDKMIQNANNDSKLNSDSNKESQDDLSADKVSETESSSKEVSDSDSSSDEKDCVEDKKSIVSKMFSLIEIYAGERANEVANVFMKFPKPELLYMMENKECLKLKIEEINKNMCAPKITGNVTVNENVELNKKKELDEKENLHVLNLCNKPNVENNQAFNIADSDVLVIKRLFEEKIYPLVYKYAGDLSPKITSMLLDLDINELVLLVENNEYLIKKIEESKTLLYPLGVSNNSKPVKEGINDTLKKEQLSGSPFLNEDLSLLKNNNSISPVPLQYNLVNTRFPNPDYILQQQQNLYLNAIFQQRSLISQRNFFVSNAQPFNNVAFPYQMQSLPFFPNLNMNDKESKAGLKPEFTMKQTLGNSLYPLVYKHAGIFAKKITNTFLEWNNDILVSLIQNEDFLKMEVDKAIKKLNLNEKDVPKDIPMDKFGKIIQCEQKENSIESINEEDKIENLDISLKSNQGEIIDCNPKTYISGFGFN